MPFVWLDYLGLAKRLGAQADEASLRSAVSRAYYASHHLCSDYCESFMGFQRPVRNVHDAVCMHLYRGNQKEKKIALKLKRLKNNRGKVDYKLGTINKKFAENSLIWADEIISDTKTLAQKNLI